jgi:hypothetical protein
MLTMLNFYFILFLSFSAQAACDYKTHVKKVFSFSGPVTVALKHLGLLKKDQVKGISTFNPISKEDFQGKRFPGGIFLSQSSFAEFSGSVVFYDESRDLDRILSPMSSIQGWQIKTRGLTPRAANNYVIKQLEHFVEGCEKEFSNLDLEVKKLEEKLLAKFSRSQSVVYFLGEFRMGKPPELVIVNDGIVKWLIEKKKITTYPSRLTYVNWSAKIMNQMPKNTLKIAVKDSAADMIKELKQNGNEITLIYPGSLVPGITQLLAWNYLMDQLLN